MDLKTKKWGKSSPSTCRRRSKIQYISWNEILMSFFESHGAWLLMFVWQNEDDDLSCQLADLLIFPFCALCSLIENQSKNRRYR